MKKTKKPAVSTLSFEIVTCIAEYLTSKELYMLSKCNKALYQLQHVDTLWKVFCRAEFGIQYNHPDQSWRDLFISCCKTKKGKGDFKRLPCSHLGGKHFDKYLEKVAIGEEEKLLHKCQRCEREGVENLYICMTPKCHQTVCDRHARQHARFSTFQNHSLYYKKNTLELFCQFCVDWVGGMETDPAEQFLASKIANNWIEILCNPESIPTLLQIKKIRQLERTLRWRDTPQYIMKTGFCFISSNWMAEWEMFVEGWRTEPPFDYTIDQIQLLDYVVSLNRVGTNPFYLNANDHAMIISTKTWDYLSHHYRVKGEKIVEQDLQPVEQFYSIIKRIEYWKRRASDFARH